MMLMVVESKRLRHLFFLHVALVWAGHELDLSLLLVRVRGCLRHLSECRYIEWLANRLPHCLAHRTGRHLHHWVMIEKILSLADSVAIRTLQGVATLEDDHIAYLLLAFGCCCLLETRGLIVYRHQLLERVLLLLLLLGLADLLNNIVKEKNTLFPLQKLPECSDLIIEFILVCLVL